MKEFFKNLVERVKGWLGIGSKEEAKPSAAAPAEGGQRPAAHEEESVMPEMPQPGILQAYDALKAPQNAASTPGMALSEGYPAAFQAAEFPQLAGQGEVAMLGNNQAFFFVSNPKGNTDPEKMKIDTTHLETLMRNARENGSRVTLMVDGDLFHDRDAFVEKYTPLRPEYPDEAKALLRQEAQLISAFIEHDGIRETAKKVIGEGKNLPENALDKLADQFVKDQFRLQGVQTERALEAAVWEVDGPEGKLLARQQYDYGTERELRGWHIGTEPEVNALAQKGDSDAHALQEAVQEMHSLPKQDLLMQARHRRQLHEQEQNNGQHR